MGISFGRLLPEACFPLLGDFAISMASMFGSNYICENCFSKMKHIKSKEMNRLTDDCADDCQLVHLMRIGCTINDIDIQSIVHQETKPQVSH